MSARTSGDADIQILVQARRFDEALDRCRAMIDANPTDPEAHDAMGFVHLMMRNRELAAEALTRAIELQPGEPAYYHTRARANIMLGRMREVISDCDEGVRLELVHARCYYSGEFHMLKALACLRVGEPDAAMEALAGVRAGHRTWVLGQLWTRDAVLEEARQAIQPSPGSARKRV